VVSRATWEQDFTYNGSTAASISLALQIPALEVGLIGVAPNRDSVSATETAQAEATVESTITHADGSSALSRLIVYLPPLDEAVFDTSA
jgi:hypothetical protein